MPLAQTIGLQQLSEYFHLPINEVAKELGVCATVLKKICRRNGIPRWPHRKIKSLDKMIRTLEATVAKKPEDEDRIRQEITTLYNKKMYLMKNPNVLVKASKASNKYKQSIAKFHRNSPSTSTATTTNSPSTTSSSSPLKSEDQAYNHNNMRHSTGTTNSGLASPEVNSQQEAATSLLNVFASLQNKLQDQVSSCSSSSSSSTASSSSCSLPPPVASSSSCPNFSSPHFGTDSSIASLCTPPQSINPSLFSLQLPRLAVPDDWKSGSVVVPQKKLATLEPDLSSSVLSGNNASSPPPSSFSATNNNSGSLPNNNGNTVASLPSWFFQERQLYSSVESILASSPQPNLSLPSYSFSPMSSSTMPSSLHPGSPPQTRSSSFSAPSPLGFFPLSSAPPTPSAFKSPAFVDPFSILNLSGDHAFRPLRDSSTNPPHFSSTSASSSTPASIASPSFPYPMQNFFPFLQQGPQRM